MSKRIFLSTRQQEQKVARYMEEINAMRAAGVTRRDLLKMGLTTTAGGVAALGGGRSFLPNLAEAASFPGAMISPQPKAPWTEPLVIPRALQPCSPVANTGLPLMKGPLPGKSQYTGAVELPCYAHTPYANGVYPSELYLEARSEDHQRWDELLTGQTNGAYQLINAANPYYANPQQNTYYELVTRGIKWNFYTQSDFAEPPSSVWIFQDLHASPVDGIKASGLVRLNADYGKPVLMRVFNMSCVDNGGVCGINQHSVHLHNAHNPPESDGGPLRFFDEGQFYDYWYPNIREGFASTHKTGTSFTGPDKKARWCPGDFKETQSTLWFHDHRMDFTSQNVYKGVASFYTLFSKDINLDTGVESADPALRGLGFPAGEFDIPLLFTDKSFQPNGEMFFDLNDTRGMVGDQITVNFKIKPYLNVYARRYRFRLLDAGPSRYYQFALVDAAGKKVSMLRIGNDGNLFEKAISQTDIRLGVAERADIVVDFSSYKAGTVLYLHNILEQTSPEKTDGKTLTLGEATKVLKIVVTAPPATKDLSNTLSVLASQAQLPLPDLVPGKDQSTAAKRATVVTGLLADKTIKNRRWDFGQSNGQWVVNGKLFDPAVIDAYPIEGKPEIWELTGGNGWSHPVHHHHAESQLLSRNGKTTIPADEVCRKDVYRIGTGADGTTNGGSLKFQIRFRDWYGDFVMHCHNVVHEDHAMMIRFKVVPPSDPNAGK